MPVFRWKGYDGKGKQVQGVRDSESPRTLRQALKREGIMLSDVSEAQVGVGKSKKKASDSQLDTVGQGLFVGLLVALRLGFVAQAFAEYRRTAKPMEIAVLTRQLGTLLRAGVQLSESLAALIEQALVEPKVRRATRPTRASKERRLETKKVRSGTKAGRGRVRFDD